MKNDKKPKSMFQFCIPVLGENDLYLGCAFKWSDGQFITCKHVINASNKNLNLVYNFGSSDVKRVQPKSVKVSEKYDLGVIYTEKEEQVGLEHHEYDGDLPLGFDIVLFGFTQSDPLEKSIEPRCIKSYVHRSTAKPEEKHIKEGVLQVNEINQSIPKGFSGGPIITLQSKLIGMSLGTNVVEKPLYLYEKEQITEKNNGDNIKMEHIEKYNVEHYGLFHSIKNIEEIIKNHM